MPLPRFLDSPGFNSFLPAFERDESGELRQVPEPFDEPDASEFREGVTPFGGGPPLVSRGDLSVFPEPPGPDRYTRIADFLRRRGKDAQIPERLAEFLPYLQRVAAGPAPAQTASMQAQAIEGR